MKKYDIAAYVWPAYTGDEPRTRIFWPEGIGEWQSVKNAEKKGDYVWGRKPLWGYVNEADPYVMEMEIDAAADHGVNVFIYDWYWYDGRPFLENCLNDGFLKARNNDRMKFYLMWANHDANTLWDKRTSDQETVIWSGRVTAEQFRVIGRRWMEKYFGHPSYYRIGGKPVVSIYDMSNFINGLGGLENAREALVWLDSEARAAGFGGVHFQMIKWGEQMINITGVDNTEERLSSQEILKALPLDSLTHYQFAHFADMDLDYSEIGECAKAEWEKAASLGKPYFPHVSAGWDNNPRFTAYRAPVTKDPTPEKFEKLLRAARSFADEHCDTPLITINSWNEWTETSYLEPDNKFGYGYLEAVKRVFTDN